MFIDLASILLRNYACVLTQLINQQDKKLLKSRFTPG
jgi:hypothetical protein